MALLGRNLIFLSSWTLACNTLIFLISPYLVNCLSRIISPRWQAGEMLPQALGPKELDMTGECFCYLYVLVPSLDRFRTRIPFRKGWVLLINRDKCQKKKRDLFPLPIPKRFGESCLSVGSWYRGSGPTGLMWRLAGETKSTTSLWPINISISSLVLQFLWSPASCKVGRSNNEFQPVLKVCAV
jgi:hypothetical protein